MTIGSAIGAFIVTTLLDLSWPVRIALIIGVLIIGLGYVTWNNRTSIAAEANETSAPADGSGDARTVPPEGTGSA